MRKMALLAVAFFGLALVAASCSKKEEPTPAKKPVTEEKVVKETKEAAQAVAAYTEQKKAEYQKQISAQLEEMQKRMAEMKAKIEQAKPEVQAKLKEQREPWRRSSTKPRKSWQT